MSAPAGLLRVTAGFRLDRRDLGWVEDELVRRGAREAHVVPGGRVAILVAARSTADAAGRASDLLERLGATEVTVG